MVSSFWTFSTSASFILLLLGTTTWAQNDTAVCNDPRYSAYTNSLHQDPCLVATKLVNNCPDSSIAKIQPVPEGYEYFSPNYVNECTCNTVTYSMWSVCAYCQGGDIAYWDDFTTNCTEKFTTYPLPLPANTNVQSWAFLPLTTNGTVNVTAIVAENKNGSLEAVGASSSTSQIIVGPSSSDSSSQSSTSSSATTTSSVSTTSSDAAPSESRLAGQGSGDSDSSPTLAGYVIVSAVGSVLLTEVALFLSGYY